MKNTLLSVVIIAKNAENILKDCIDSVRFADEIIVVDAQSTDNTVHIAKKLGAGVVGGDTDDFSKQRTIGMQEAKGEWVLYVDTDERISKELQKSIINAISTTDFAAYQLKRKNFYLGNYPWPKIELLERLFLREKLKGWQGKLHETPIVRGPSGELDGYLLHYTHRDLESMLSKTILWSQTEAQLRLDANHPKIVIWRLIRVMMTGFWDSYISQGGWKAGIMGLIESTYQAYSMFVTYAVLWEKQQHV